VSDVTTRLKLPYLQAAQAQKHVTHNEALERLDLLVHLTVGAFDATTPPVSPLEGEVWAIGVSPVGDWAGHAGEVAAWSNGGWLFFEPQNGWLAALATELRIWTGSSWDPIDMGALQNLPGVGINTASDLTNRLAVASDATLLTHAGAGHQLKLNKATAGETASLLFQTGWSGRAEMGTSGSDDFALKVSADGSTWQTAVSVAAGSSQVVVPLDLSVTGQISGTAVTQTATDQTAGRLLKTGDFGLGAAIALGAGDDLDALTASGLYYNPASGNTTGNHYPVAAAGAVLNIRRTSTNWVQTFTAEGGASAAEDVRQFTRSIGAGGWTPWVEVIHQGRIIGTVSQAAGVPTGTVIERGSNANGAYVRYADGTQMCWQTATAVDCQTAQGALWANAGVQSWTFPVAFIAAPAMSGSAGATGRWLAPATPSAASCDYLVLSALSDAATHQPSLVAIGRWV